MQFFQAASAVAKMQVFRLQCVQDNFAVEMFTTHAENKNSILGILPVWECALKGVSNISDKLLSLKTKKTLKPIYQQTNTS